MRFGQADAQQKNGTLERGYFTWASMPSAAW